MGAQILSVKSTPEWSICRALDMTHKQRRGHLLYSSGKAEHQAVYPLTIRVHRCRRSDADAADATRTGRLSSHTCACQCLHEVGGTHRRLVPGHDHPGRLGAVHARQVVQQPAQLLRADGGPATQRRTQP